jgi:molybdopterin-guanine dinucleotide biosynthesis protein A
MTNDHKLRHRLAAAILAGGQAKRLDGVNKGTLRLGNAQIVDIQLTALREVASAVFVVGSDSPARSARGLAVAPDAVSGMGALGGIYTAIVHSPCDRTLVVACDMPFLSVDFLEHMAAIEDADLVIPKSSRAAVRHLHPRLPPGHPRAHGALHAARLPPGRAHRRGRPRHVGNG